MGSHLGLVKPCFRFSCLLPPLLGLVLCSLQGIFHLCESALVLLLQLLGALPGCLQLLLLVKDLYADPVQLSRPLCSVLARSLFTKVSLIESFRGLGMQ